MDLTKDTLKQDWQDTKDDVKNGLDTVAHKTETTGDSIKDTAKEGYYDAKEKIDNI